MNNKSALSEVPIFFVYNECRNARKLLQFTHKLLEIAHNLLETAHNYIQSLIKIFSLKYPPKRATTSAIINGKLII